MTTITLPLSIASYALLSSYCLCGGIFEHLSVFRGWLHIHEPGQLKALQAASGYGALYTYVIPKAALTFFNAYLLVTNPTGIYERTRLGLKVGLAMLLVSWTSSAFIQVPLQLRIQKTGDPALVKRLERTTWTRTVAMVLHGCSVGWILMGAF